MLSVAVCDDELNVCDYLNKRIITHLSKIDEEANVRIFSDGSPLCKECENSPDEFDIIFLDIKMKNTNGVDCARLLREYGVKALIVFVTSSAEYVFSGYEVKAFRYILKTELVNAFDRIFSECLNELNKDETSIYTIQTSSELRKIRLDDILYFESDKRKLLLHTKNELISFYSKLDDIESDLKEKDFVRIHQSYLVNAKQIKALKQSDLLLTDGTFLPVSKSRAKNVREAQLWAMR